jgi:hypothetical protein
MTSGLEQTNPLILIWVELWTLVRRGEIAANVLPRLNS